MHERNFPGMVLLDVSSTCPGHSTLETTEPPSSSFKVQQELRNRHELIEFLDSEPLFDYLVQNGVLTRQDVADILVEEDSSRQNSLLLKYVESHQPNGVQLFTNVLRQTGQHYLANLLDDGARIKALSGSGKVTCLLFGICFISFFFGSIRNLRV